MRLTRRRFLKASAVAVAGAIGGGAYARFVEPRWLAVREREVTLGRGRLASPIRVLHLSDLHWSDVVSLAFIEKAFTLGLELEPDLICLTGDYITAGTRRDLGDFMPVFSKLTAAAPCFAVLGNHDGGRWSARWGGFKDTRAMTKALEAAGVRVLADTATAASVRGASICITGTTDFWSDAFAPAPAFQSGSGDVTLVLAHNPDTKNAIGDYPWDLMLSGHTHGGQFALPLLGTPFAPVRDHEYVAGLKPWKDRHIHVSRGVGNLHGVRFNCRPEVNVVVMR